MNKLFLYLTLAFIFLMEIVFVQGISNLELSVHDNYKEILPGNDVWFSIKIANLGNMGRADVSLHYWVSDDNDNIIAENKETTAVQTQASFVRNFNIPMNAEPGKYMLNIKMDYGGGEEVVANTSFNVVEKKINKQMYYIIAVAAVLILALIIFIFSYKKLKAKFERLQVKIKVRKIIENRKL